MKSADLRLKLFVGATAAAAAIVLGLSVVARPLGPSLLLLALVLGAMLFEVLAVEFSALSVSIAYSIIAAATMLLGPVAGGLVAGFSTIPPAIMTKENKLLRGLFNLAQLTLAALAAGWMYLVLGGRAIVQAPLRPTEFPRMILPVLALAGTQFLVNTALVGIVASIQSGRSFIAFWRSTFAWSIPTQAALTVLALALAQMVASEGIVSLVLFVVPLVIARQFYDRYVRLRGAYADTVRSLVAVIEEKDAYTRGHSERVASYAVLMAPHLGLDERRTERLELAGLLHDLGKVGVSKDILSAPRGLRPNEFAIIQTHPGIGAEIIESVPFLADLVPWVLAHHERLDGAGYSQHLTGAAIPFEARILGVADAFDAMTSTRPYRPPLTVDASIQQLREGMGTQFDPQVVDVFVALALSGELSPVLDSARLTNEAV